MKQEEKELLLKDLCGRLPYGVKLAIDGFKSAYPMKAISGDCVTISTEVGDDHYFLHKVRPYLRPLCTSTSDERQELSNMLNAKKFGIYKQIKGAAYMPLKFLFPICSNTMNFFWELYTCWQ